MTYSITWDLDRIFPNGSESKELSQRMTQLTEQTKEYHQLITEWTPESAQGKEQFAEILTLQGKISNGFSQCNSFLTALISANTNDTKAKILSGDLYNLLPAIQLAETIFTKKITEISAEHWQDLLAEEPFKTMAFRLNELRRDGKKLLSEQEENIINTLSLDGLNAWSTHYDTIVASIVIPFEEKDGSVTELSKAKPLTA